MGKESNIQWCDATWNIARGCTKVDADCKFCYMYRDSMDKTRYNPNQVIRTKTVFDFPLKYKETHSKARDGQPLIFTSSLTDFFHEEIDSYRDEAWDIIRRCPHLTFQILTKRPERILDHLPPFWDEIKDHVWLGTSVGSQAGMQRAFDLIKLRQIAPTLFLSLEPLHEALDIAKKDIPVFNDDYGSGFESIVQQVDWVIIGGESGNDKGLYRYRPCELSWIELLVDQCLKTCTPVFVKQLGTHLAKDLKLRDRSGGDISEWPLHLQIRQFPKFRK